MDRNECQFVILHNIVRPQRQPINKRVKRLIRSHLSESQNRFVLKYYHNIKVFLIEATFDKRRATLGCGFMDCQTKYYGTVQRVLALEQFVDECDMKVKRLRVSYYWKGLYTMALKNWAV